MRSFSALLACTLSILLSVVLAPADARAHQVASDWKKYDRLSLVTGPMEYVEAKEDNEVDGYRPASEITLQGSVKRVMTDYGSADTSLSVFNDIESRFKRQGYAILYRCERDTCGDAAGWPLYIDHRMSGLKGKQYYIIARRAISLPDTDEYVSVFISEVGGLPRSMVISVTGHSEQADTQASKIATQLEHDGHAEIDGIFFALDSDEITDASKPALEAMADVLKAKSSLEVFIVGHTDITGTYEHNLDLSKRRAESVKNYLIRNLGITEAQMQAVGIGPVAPRAADGSRKLNRRVELVAKTGQAGN